MAWSKKEQSFLKDLQNEERLCVEKYRKASQEANDGRLKEIFAGIEKAEQGHYETVTQMLESGEAPAQNAQGGGSGKSKAPTAEQLKSQASRAGKQQDEYLLSDLLGTEKYVSAVYNTAVFEFSDEKARQTLGAIQQQEQAHGKQLSAYMQANRMYC